MYHSRVDLFHASQYVRLFNNTLFANVATNKEI